MPKAEETFCNFAFLRNPLELNRPALFSLIFVLGHLVLYAQPINLFPGLTVKNDPYVNVIADGPDGCYFLATMVDAVNGTPTGNIAKVSSTGSVVPGFHKVVVNSHILDIVHLTTGKILIAGWFTKVNGVAYGCIARLDADGSLDLTFPSLPLGTFSVGGIAVQSSGKIIIAGNFILGGYEDLVRLNSNGTVDATFQPFTAVTHGGYVSDVEVDSEDNIWLSDTKSVYRLDPQGNITSGFPVVSDPGSLYYLATLGNKVYAGGGFTTIGGVSRNRIALINPNGSIDPGFVPSSPLLTSVYGLAVRNDGKVLVNQLNVVNVYHANGAFQEQIQQFLPEAIHVDQNQQILISGGTNMSVKGNTVPFLARISASFAYDNTFTCMPTYFGGVTSIAGYRDGRILLGGNYNTIGFNSGNKRLVRINRDGTIDPTFNPNIPPSSTLPAFTIVSILLQPDEKIVVATTSTVSRFMPSGAPDITFITSYVTSGESFLSSAKDLSGNLFVSGAHTAINSYSSPGIIKLNANGSVITSFRSQLPAGSYVTNFNFQSDNKIIVVGHFPSTPTAKAVMRLLPSGDIDNTFSPSPIQSNGIWNVGMDSQDRIYIAGNFFNYGGTGRNYLVRLGSNGVLDAAFTPTLPLSNDINMESLEIISDNEIVVGSRTTYGETALYVFDASGNLIDKPFAHLGPNSSITSTDYNKETLYVAGRVASENSAIVSGLGVVNLITVTGAADNLEVIRGSRYRADLTWTNTSPNASLIAIERSETNSDSFVTVGYASGLSGTYSDSQIKGVVKYYYRVRAINSSSITPYSNMDFIEALPKLDQTIVFDPVSEKTTIDTAFSLSASASSGLLVTFTSSDFSVASIEDSVVTIHKPGMVDLTASQLGDEEHHAAPPEVTTLAISLPPEKMIYPNPSDGRFIITLDTPTFSGSSYVYNSNGSMVYTQPLQTENGVVQVDISILPPGLYFLRLLGASEFSYRLFKDR